MTRPFPSYIPPKLRARMGELGFNMQELAEKAGIPKNTLRDNLAGLSPMTLRNALQLLEALNYEVEGEPLELLQELANPKITPKDI